MKNIRTPPQKKKKKNIKELVLWMGCIEGKEKIKK